MKNEAQLTLPPEIENLLNNTPETTQEMLDELAEANRKIVNNPEFIADLERAKFVDAVLASMGAQNIKRADLARSIGKTRQYVQKVLDEDTRVSFTLKTMVNLCCALNKKLNIEIVDNAIRSEACIQFPTTNRVVAIEPLKSFETPRFIAKHQGRKLLNASMKEDAKKLSRETNEELPLSA